MLNCTETFSSPCKAGYAGTAQGMAYRRRLKNKKPPAGWELIEEVIEDFEAQLKEAVNEEHEGRRKNELTWKIHRIHWEKNRFIYDLFYVRKVMSRELVRPCTSFAAARVVPALAASHSPADGTCSRAQYDWLVREKIADGPLISKWRKPGYEILCSMLAIQKGNHNFGTTSHCRRAPATLPAYTLHALASCTGPSKPGTNS